MLLLSRVCAEFRDKTGAVIFKVTPRTRLTFQEAPENIREDPLFQMLLNDHSIEVTNDTVRKKQLENDPGLKSPETAANISFAESAEEGKPSGRKSAEKK